MKGTKGITLIALVITIVIIIILSTIAINFTFGENGLITRAQQAAEMSEVSRILEQLEMAKGSAYIDGAGEIDPDHYFDILEEEGIINDKETDVVDNGDGTYDVTTEGDRVFEVTLEPNGDLDIEYIGKNNEPRISSINVTDKTENSVSVEVVTKNVENAEYTYSYKKTDEGEEAWQEAGSSSSNTFTFNGLENNTSYDIKVTVTTGDTTIEKTITVQLGTGAVEIPDGTITFGQATWQGDGTASMQISTTESGYTLQYQIGGTSGQWTTITSGQSITGLKHGDTIYAKITDGENDSEIQQTTIEDKVVPEVSVTSTGNTSNSISVSVSATDKESGMSDNVTYTYSIKQSGSADYSEEATDISQNTYTFSNLQSGISYDIKVEVKADKAGNVGTGYLAGQTTTDIPGGESLLEDGTITVSEPEWADSKASIDISTDSGYQIEYQVNGTSDGSWNNIGNSGTVSELNYGDTVNIRLTDGTNHGDFVTVTIGDEIAPTVNVTLVTSTSNSISVNAVATDNESGMSANAVYTYYIKESSQDDGSYAAPENAKDISANTYTFVNLKQNTSYDIKVEVKADLAGNMGTGTLLNQTTKTIPSGGGETEQGITFEEPIWSKGKASITVSTKETEYTIEYKLSEPDVDSGWTTIENNGTISELSHGSTVYARLTDGSNHGDYATKNIQDEINPVVDVKLDGLITSSSIKVNVTASDNESGMTASPTYTYYIKQSSEEDSAYKTQSNSANLSTNTYTFTGLTQGTSYDVKVEVTGDNAGNTGAGYLAGQTTATIPDGSGEDVEEGAITFGTVSWSSNKASISVSTNTSYQIEYQVGAITENNWTGIANNGTISNLNYGDTVYARLTDGVNHGEYAVASIDDGIEPEASIEATEVTSRSITVKVTASDAQSGLATSETYKYYLDSEGSPRETSTNDTYTYSELNGGTGYTLKVVVTDVAGNEKEATVQATTEIPELFSDIYDTTTEYTDSEGNKAIIPGGYAVGVSDDINKINEGLVITDKIDENHESTGNQFVWIPVNDISQIANQTSGTDANGRQNYQGKLYNFSTTGATAKNYNYGQGTTGYREPDILSRYDGESEYLSILGLSSSSEFETQLQEEFNEVIESVDTYGGFYIGRYETGNLASNTDTVPVVVKGNNDICSVNWYYQYQSSKLIGANNNVVSTMLWGCMWDRTLIWLTETGDKTYSDLMDSRSWGNYSDSTGAAATNSESKQPTGTNDAWQANNIYDLAGNVMDWTIEAFNTTSRVSRGGRYSGDGSYNPASYESNIGPSVIISDYGSRSALYIALPDMSTAKPNPGEDGPEFGKNTPVQDDQGNTVVIPGGFHLDADSGTSVEEGIVIEDASGNQFVWIPTGTYQTSSGAKTNNLTRRTFTSSGATEVSGDNAINGSARGKYYYGEGDSRSIAYNQIGAFKDSVTGNGGFYIGRYEQGTGNVCKAGVTPYANIARNAAKSQAEAMYSNNSYVVSELISSYAWDTVLNFICQTNTEGYILATTDSSQYGNMGATGVRQNTGGYAADNYSNIHDLLGNCQEWTTEYYYDSSQSSSDTQISGIVRGGYYDGQLFSASRRSVVNELFTENYYSFRVQLYLE